MLKKILSNKAYPVVFLAIIVTISVVFLIAVNSFTSTVVESRRDSEVTGILEEIFPEMTRYELEGEVYIIYKDETKTGYAFRASGSGYGGNIEIIVGLGDDFGIIGISILSQTETPGVGSRITESSFIDQFKGLSASDIALSSEGGKIDAITGATISSRAVVSAIREKMIEVIETLK